MNSEHFLDERSPEMQKPHLERPLVLGSQGNACFLEILPHIGLEPHALRRLPAARRAGLDEHAVPDVAGAGKLLGILETVVAAEAADGLAFLLDERQAGMLLDGLPQPLQLTVYRFFSQRRIESSRVEKDVESSRPAELPRQPLSEPYVTVSRHTALLVPSAGK